MNLGTITPAVVNDAASIAARQPAKILQAIADDGAHMGTELAVAAYLTREGMSSMMVARSMLQEVLEGGVKVRNDFFHGQMHVPSRHLNDLEAAQQANLGAKLLWTNAKEALEAHALKDPTFDLGTNTTTLDAALAVSEELDQHISNFLRAGVRQLQDGKPWHGTTPIAYKQFARRTPDVAAIPGLTPALANRIHDMGQPEASLPALIKQSALVKAETARLALDQARQTMR